MNLSARQVVRYLLMGAVGLAIYIALERYGFGWLVFAVGLGVAAVLLGLATWHGKRADRRFKDIQQELDESSDEKKP